MTLTPSQIKDAAALLTEREELQEYVSAVRTRVRGRGCTITLRAEAARDSGATTSLSPHGLALITKALTARILDIEHALRVIDVEVGISPSR